MEQVAIYTRVSSQRQKEEKTIESQLAELREVCEKDKVIIVKEYIDDGWSGATLARPGLDDLRSDAEKKLFEVVYFHSPDRLARDFIDQVIVFRELEKRGIKVVFKDKFLTEENKLNFDIESGIAKHERKKILERTHRGRIHKAKRGLLVGAYPPFGYDYIPKSKNRNGYYKINKREADIVKLIFGSYIQFQSIERVKQELVKRGIKPRKENAAWSDSTISRILAREDYIGRAYYNKTYSFETKNKERRYLRIPKNGRALRNKNEWIGPIMVPAIIEKSKFNLVRILISKNSRPFGTKKYFYLLSGLGILKCMDCGYSLQADRCNGHSYYRCRRCGIMIPIEKVDRPTWNFISKAMENPGFLLKNIKDFNQDEGKIEQLLNEEKESLIKEKNKIKNKQDKLLELYTEEEIEKQQLLEKVGDYQQKEKEIAKKLKEIEIRLAQIKNETELVKDFEQFYKLTKSQFKLLSPQRKRKLISFLLRKVSYSPKKNEIKIESYVPNEINQITTPDLYE